MQIRTDCSVGAGVTLILPYGTTDDVKGRNDINEDGSITAVYHNSNSSSTAAAERNPMGADNISLHTRPFPETCPYDNCQDNISNPDYCTHLKCIMCDPETGVCSLCVTKVVITSNVTLTVYGTMLISGELDGGGAGNEYTGQTSGYYAQLVLESNAQLYVIGTLHLPGFITESSENNESLITISRSATIYQPFVVRDFKGGTVTGSIYHSITDGVPFSPFNEFGTMNVYADMHVYGTVNGYANIYANDAQNATITPLIGIDNSSLITLSKNGSYVVVRQDPETEVMKLDFYGGATVNTFKVTVQVPILGELTMTSQQFVFPISWMYDITLHNGEYYMQNENRFKLLPGAKFTVERDALLDISYLNIYESFTKESAVKHYPRKYQNIPAMFIVNGTVIADELGGKVYSTNNNATLTIRKFTSITTEESLTYASNTEVMAGVLSSSSGRVKTWYSIPSKVTLHYMYNQNDELIVNDFSGNDTLTAGTPYASDSTMKNWKEKSTFTLQVDGYTVSVNGGAPQSGVVEVEEGDTIVFNLASNQFISLNGATEFSYSDYGALTWGTYTLTNVTKSNLATLKVLTAVKLTLNGNGGATVTISYTGDSNNDGVLDATVKATKSKSVGWLGGSLSVSVKNSDGQEWSSGKVSGWKETITATAITDPITNSTTITVNVS